MKKLIFLVLISVLVIGCGDKRPFVAIPFKKDKTVSNEKGLPVGPGVHYFPDSLLYDSIKRKIDSLELGWRIGYRSVMLYRMYEPVLSNVCLGKKIYRLLAIRSGNGPFCIRVERNDVCCRLTVKMMARKLYPCRSDSGVWNIYYDLVSERSYRISHDAWDSLETLVKTTGLWNSKPRLDLGHFQIDGSNWILEGHEQRGYQVKAVPSPRFEYAHTNINVNKYDVNDRYKDLFLYMVKLGKLDHERLY
jgi:hypothetical protein